MVRNAVPKIENYSEYIKMLKMNMAYDKEFAKVEHIRKFINKYDLDKDWKITIEDVKEDIETIRLKNGKIYTYAEYLDKLEENFADLDVMPTNNQIEQFIGKYHLYEDWNIVVEDVEKDLQSIILNKETSKLKNTFVIPVTRNKSNYEVKKNNIYSQKLAPFNFANSYHGYTNTTLPSKNVGERSHNQYKCIPSATKHLSKSEGRTTILIDGDNHLGEAIRGIEHSTNKTIEAYFSQPGAKEKFDRKYKNKQNVKSKLISPGNQAVDNVIKSRTGQLLKEKNQNIKIISQDKGFQRYINKKKEKSELNGNKVCVCKNVDEALTKKK